MTNAMPLTSRACIGRGNSSRSAFRYLGLVPKEDSSGDRIRLGAITKAGNTHCRHVLVQAAWSDRHRSQTSVDLKRRQEGQPPAVITHAMKAQHRLHARFNHLSYRKRSQIAVVAVARELVGFLWAVMQDVVVPDPQSVCCRVSWFDVWRRGSMCEHSRRRYAAWVGRSTRIPEPRMSQLPTNPILAALPRQLGNRRISAGLTVDAASHPRRITITSTLLTRSP